MDYIASLSYGKDSLAMLHVITDILHKPLTRIVTADVWATDTISADPPDMVEFKAYADAEIKRRWGIEVEHICATNKDGEKVTFEGQFYRTRTKGNHVGEMVGWPNRKVNWCNGDLKMAALNKLKALFKGCVQYVGIADDELERKVYHKGKEGMEMPLVEAGWTEQMCREWCEENNLLAPIYARGNRGGCWFCYNATV